MSKSDDVWYLSARAVREYLAIVGRRDDDGGPEWDRAGVELQDMGRRAMAAQGGGQPTRTGALIQYRGGRPLRLTLLVSTVPRPEGPLPQLVSVQRGSQAEREQGRRINTRRGGRDQ